MCIKQFTKCCWSNRVVHSLAYSLFVDSWSYMWMSLLLHTKKGHFHNTKYYQMHTVFWKAYCKCTLTQKQLLSISKMLLICVGICIYTIDVCFNGGKFYSINVPKCRKVNFCFSKSFLVGGYASIIYYYSFVHQNNSLVLQCTEISLFMKIKPNQWIYSIYIKT